MFQKETTRCSILHPDYLGISSNDIKSPTKKLQRRPLKFYISLTRQTMFLRLAAVVDFLAAKARFYRPHHHQERTKKEPRYLQNIPCFLKKLAVKELPAIPETREREFETVRMWDAADRVWVDVTSQLQHSGMFWDNRKVIQLKVGLAEQAKKLAFLQKKNRVHQR